MTGCRVSWKWAVACLPTEESQQPMLPQSRHWRSDTQRVPSARQVAHAGSATVSTAGWDVEVVALRPPCKVTRAERIASRGVGAGVEHRLLDVEHARAPG